MSISPSGVFMPSVLFSRSASQAPPVYSPTMALLAPMRGLSSATSCSHSFSASGSLGKVLFQYELRGDRVYGLLLHAPQAMLGFNRGVALVHPCHRQLEAPLQASREIFRLPGHL